MRIALFSDIHGNLTALEAVLAAIADLGGADLRIAAGDLISGESATDEVLDLLLHHDVQMVRGDSDTEEKLIMLEQQALAAPGTTRSSAAFYHDMRLWMDRHLSAAGRALLDSLPLTRTFTIAPGQRLLVCHASPRSDGDRVCAAVCHPNTIREAYAAADAEVIAFGHAHTPYVRLLDGRLYVNVASVGYHPDGLSCLTMLTFTDGQWVVEQRRIPFDAAREHQRMLDRGVPLAG